MRLSLAIWSRIYSADEGVMIESVCENGMWYNLWMDIHPVFELLNFVCEFSKGEFSIKSAKFEEIYENY